MKKKSVLFLIIIFFFSFLFLNVESAGDENTLYYSGEAQPFLPYGNTIPAGAISTEDYFAAPKPYEMDKIERGGVGSTGDMNLNIPLITVPGRGGLDFPIALHYAAGIKVDQPASWVGLGWNLETGSVKRLTINEMDHSYINNMNGQGQTADRLPDAYSVSTPVGSFRFYNAKPLEDINIRDMYMNPVFKVGGASADKLSAFPNETINGQDLPKTYDYEYFIYTSSDGTRYVYKLALKSSAVDIYHTGDYIGEGKQVHNNEWLLTAILSPDYVDAGGDKYYPLDSLHPAKDNKGNWIVFEYRDGEDNDIGDRYENNGINGMNHKLECNGYFCKYSYKEVTYPSKIITPTYVAEFYLEDKFAGEDYVDSESTTEISPSDVDYLEDNGYTGDNEACEKLKRLSSIELYQYLGTGSERYDNYISKVEFYYRPGETLTVQGPPCSGGQGGARLILDKVQVFGKGGDDDLPPYEFIYFNLDQFSQSPPIIDLVPANEQGVLNHRDLFGYYSANSNGYAISEFEDDGYNSHTNDARAWSIYQVKYPSGAVASFNYDTDKFTASLDSFYAKNYIMGGVRLAGQSLTDANGLTHTYSYGYETGYLNTIPLTWKFFHDYPNGPQFGEMCAIKFLNFYDQATPTTHYSSVRENLPAGGGYIKRDYTTSLNTGINPVYDLSGCELDIDDGPKIGKLGADYSCPCVYEDGKLFAFIYFVDVDMDWKRGQLTKEEYCNSNGNCPKKVEYQYNYVPDVPILFGHNTNKKMLISTGWPKMFKKTETLDGVSKITTYEYHDTNKQVASVTEAQKKVTKNMFIGNVNNEAGGQKSVPCLYSPFREYDQNNADYLEYTKYSSNHWLTLPCATHTFSVGSGENNQITRYRYTDENGGYPIE